MKRISIIYIWLKYSIISLLNYLEKKLIINIIIKKPIKDKNYYKKEIEYFKNKNNLKNAINKKTDLNFFLELAYTNQISLKKSKNDFSHGLIIYEYLKKFIETNQIDDINILDIGTAKGYSSICLSKALLDTNNTGRIFSIDIIPHNTKIYWNSPNDFNGKSTRYETLKKYKKYLKKIIFINNDSTLALKSIHFDRINFCFIDGDHSYQKILSDVEIISSYQLNGDIIIFDDFDDFKDVNNAINEIIQKYNYSKKEIIQLVDFRKKIAILSKN